MGESTVPRSRKPYQLPLAALQPRRCFASCRRACRAGRVAARFRGKILVTTDVQRQRIVEIEFSGLVRASRAQR